MNFLDELRNLDFNDIGRWPQIFHVLFVALFFVVASGAGFYFLVYKEQMPRLEKAEREESKSSAKPRISMPTGNSLQRSRVPSAPC